MYIQVVLVWELERFQTAKVTFTVRSVPGLHFPDKRFNFSFPIDL